MKIICIGLIVLCISCNQSAEKKEDPITPAATVVTKQPEDSLTIQLRTAVTAIETKELGLVGTIKWIYIDSVRHEMISLKDFYKIQKDELAKEMKFSTNKAKTEKALAYLDKMIARSSSQTDVYKLTFHMKALLANNTAYDEQHIKFLRKDLSEITIVFPN